MNLLDNKKGIKKIDKSNVYSSVANLPNQCIHAYQDTKNLKVPSSYKNINSIVMTGMGGSGLGARVIESVYGNELKVPLLRINDYNLPSWVGTKTLVICSSYSGNTEETISTAKQAMKNKCKWMAIAAGGTLLNLAQKEKVPFYKINPKFNPSNQPRMAIGYSVVGQIALVAKACGLTIGEQEVMDVVTAMKKIIEKNKIEKSLSLNQSKKLAKNLKGKNILFVSSQHLVGAMHTVNNQLNENAKTISYDFEIPEINHHLMEGLKHPETNNDNLFFFFASSCLYPDRIRKRFKITKEVVSKNKISAYEYKLVSKTKITQAFELIQFGAFMNFYLSVCYKQNPAPIPWVDYFKKRLSQ